MTRFAVFRIGRALLTLWVTVTIVFIATRMSGDVTDWLLPDSASPQEKAALRVTLGLQRPVAEQYGIYIKSTLRGDFGRSYLRNEPVLSLYKRRLPQTVKLAFGALGFAVAFGTAMGAASARFHGSPFDRALVICTASLHAVPAFVLGLGSILLFSMMLRVLPSGGFGTFRHYVMPWLVLSVAPTTALFRLSRAAVLDVLESDYVRASRGRGYSELSVLVRHALRNALPPVVSMVGLLVGTMIAGTVVVETVFSRPGIGRLLVSATLSRDYPVLQFGVLILSGSVIIANTTVDIALKFLDPRTRHGGPC